MTSMTSVSGSRFNRDTSDTGASGAASSVTSVTSVNSVTSRFTGLSSPRPYGSTMAPPAPVGIQPHAENVTHLERQLSKEREDNRKLHNQMDAKDKKIAELEK